MAELEGPFRVSAKLQLRLPTRFADRMGVSPGDDLFWVFDAGSPDSVRLVLADTVNRRYSMGEEIESATQAIDRAAAQADAAHHAPDSQI